VSGHESTAGRRSVDEEGRLNLGTDGRDLDPRLAPLTGSGADLRAAPGAPDHPMPGSGAPTWDRIPSAPRPGSPTYYDQPVVKAPPWGRRIAAYLVLGGMAGASATFAAAAGPRALGRGYVVATGLAAGAGTAGSLLLVSDLGRPERALNMYRVARPTSPMSVGTYLLSGTIGASGVAMILGRRPGAAGRLGRAAGAAAGVLGVPLAGYTGVLLGTTALPGWNVGMRTLPPLFMGSAVAAAGSAMTPLLGGSAALAVDVYRMAGQLAELSAERAHDAAIGSVDGLDAVYASQPGWRVGRWLTLASLAAGLLPPVRRRRAGRIAIALAGLLGSVAVKVAVFDAGMASAADPRLVDAAARRRSS
jgi:hypothetical protein